MKNHEKREISEQEVRIYDALLSNKERWMTSKEVAEKGSVAGRTARAHLLRFVGLGLIDQAEVFPAHRYRWSAYAVKRNVGYLNRLKAAKAALAG